MLKKEKDLCDGSIRKARKKESTKIRKEKSQEGKKENKEHPIKFTKERIKKERTRNVLTRNSSKRMILRKKESKKVR